MTATRSPLNNRVVRSTPGEAEGRTTTLKGSPYTAAGALFQSAFVVFLLPQVLRTLRLLSEDAFSVISTAQVEIFHYNGVKHHGWGVALYDRKVPLYGRRVPLYGAK